LIADFFSITASFTAPENIGTNPSAMLWLLPLAMAVAVVYKATKVEKIEPVSFIKEAVVLFGSIVVFIVAAALVLLTLSWLVIE
jgi:hypothetical protein